jgi:hypothetical protein
VKTKIKIIISVSLVIFTIIVSNVGQLIFSNEQFQKENNNIKLKQ